MHCLISSLQSKKVELILPLLYKFRHWGTHKLRNLLKVTHLESDRVWNHSLRLHNTDFQKVKSVCGKIIPLPKHWKSLSFTENVQRVSRFCPPCLHPLYSRVYLYSPPGEAPTTWIQWASTLLKIQIYMWIRSTWKVSSYQFPHLEFLVPLV